MEQIVDCPSVLLQSIFRFHYRINLHRNAMPDGISVEGLPECSFAFVCLGNKVNHSSIPPFAILSVCSHITNITVQKKFRPLTSQVYECQAYNG